MKKIIITGSSSGFGFKAAKDFADKDYRVFATMRNPNGKNASVKADLEGHSSLIKVVDMDVTNDDSVKNAMESILAEAGNIDILINNAGIMYLGITEAFSVEQAKFQMETNYFGAMRVMQAILPSGQAPAYSEVLETYGELAGVSAAMGENFAQMLQSKGAPDPQWVVDAYLKLAEMTAGQRPTRTIVGITWGTDTINELTQPIQDNILKEMQLDSVLGGASI